MHVGRTKMYEMKTIEKFKQNTSDRFRKWMKHIHSCINDSKSPYSTNYPDMSPLLGGVDDKNASDGEGNVDIIMKTLRSDVLDIIEDSDGPTKPSWIVYKLDTLENNIRESCNLQNAWLSHPVVRQELLQAQEKYIVRLIEEIMDDVFQAWNKLKRRKKLGKERSINSVVSVLRILKKEVCQMLRVLNLAEFPCGDNFYVGMKTKSFNECLFQPAKHSVWKRNDQSLTEDRKQVNVFGSKSFPIYNPKENGSSSTKNVRFKKIQNIYNQTDQINLQKDIFHKHNPSQGDVKEILNVNKTARQVEKKVCEDEASHNELESQSGDNIKRVNDIGEENNAFVFTQFTQQTKSTFPRFLSRFAPSKGHAEAILESTSINILNGISKRRANYLKSQPKVLCDASTLTDPYEPAPKCSGKKQIDLSCGTDTSPFCKVDVGTNVNCWNDNVSNNLYCNKRAWSNTVNRNKRDESMISENSLEPCESLPAINIMRQEIEDSSHFRKQLTKQQRESSLPIKRPSSYTDFESNTIAENSEGSDSDDSYFSCAPSDNNFQISSALNKLKDSQKPLKPSTFSCKSVKFSELERKKQETRLEYSKYFSVTLRSNSPLFEPTVAKPTPLRTIGSQPKSFECCTLAFLEDIPVKDLPSLTPDDSHFSMDRDTLSTDEYKRPKFHGIKPFVGLRKSQEDIPVCSYISDSQFSSLCLSANSSENLKSHLNNYRRDELIQAR